MNLSPLAQTARALVASNKGILAADESTGTIDKRFKTIGLANTEDHRRAYRELLFSTPNFGEFISGVILYDETIRQKAKNGTSFVDVLHAAKSIPGIKVDMGAVPLIGSPEEKMTQGLDGLRERLKEYYQLGARFAKWRAVITIGAGIPSTRCMKVNARGLALYAALCQEQNIVPIVEPEVLMDADNTLERCDEVTRAMLDETFDELALAGVALEGMLLKPNMVISGKLCKKQASVQEVAQATVECFRRCVPAAVPGIVFLSGGQSSTLATAHLNAMSAMGPHPWPLGFSYGRALQDEALQAWKGDPLKIAQGQRAFYKRALTRRRVPSPACRSTFRCVPRR